MEDIILSKIEELKQHIQGEQKIKINYKDFIIDVTAVPPPPKPILSIKQLDNKGEQTLISILNRGDISLLSGLQKSRKTFFCSCIISSMINGSYSNLLFSQNVKKVAYIDTEQGDYHAGKTANRIYNITKSNFHYFKLRTLTPIERKEIIEDFLLQNKDIDFVIIDGLVDLIYDFNNLKESQDTIQWLMKLSTTTDTHILSVLHTNIGDNAKKPRGHIGTIAMQIVETHLHIEKLKTEGRTLSLISANNTRDKEFNPFELEIDGLGIPHLYEHIEQEENIITINSNKSKYFS